MKQSGLYLIKVQPAFSLVRLENNSASDKGSGVLNRGFKLPAITGSVLRGNL